MPADGGVQPEFANGWKQECTENMPLMPGPTSLLDNLSLMREQTAPLLMKSTPPCHIKSERCSTCYLTVRGDYRPWDHERMTCKPKGCCDVCVDAQANPGPNVTYSQLGPMGGRIPQSREALYSRLFAACWEGNDGEVHQLLHGSDQIWVAVQEVKMGVSFVTCLSLTLF